MTAKRRQSQEEFDEAMREKRDKFCDKLDAAPVTDTELTAQVNELILDRDKYLATLPQDAPVQWERDVLKKQAKKAKKQEQEEEEKADPTLAAMRRDTRKMIITLRWAVVNALELLVANGELSNAELVQLYTVLK